MTTQVASTDSSALRAYRGGHLREGQPGSAGRGEMSGPGLALTHPGRGVDLVNAVLHRVASDPDEVLVERLRRQEAGAAEALVGAYGDRVYRLAIRITGNAPDAEEVVQDALWSATRKIATFRGDAAFGTWLYRITANAAYQKLRGRRTARHEVSWEDLAPSFDDQGQHVEPVLDWSARAKDPAIQAELRSVLGSAIGELPGAYRTTLLLRDVDGLSNVEIAEALHVTLPTVKSRVHRARLYMRRRLADYMGGSPASLNASAGLAYGA